MHMPYIIARTLYLDWRRGYLDHPRDVLIEIPFEILAVSGVLVFGDIETIHNESEVNTFGLIGEESVYVL